MAKSVKVSVPQADDEIVITVGGGEPLRYKVEAGSVDVPVDQVELFLANVTGSSMRPATPAAKEK